MKAIDILENVKSYTRRKSECDAIDEAIEEIKTLQQELKQGQDNFNKLWNMYSELKKENKELEEEMRNLTTELILNMLKDNK